MNRLIKLPLIISLAFIINALIFLLIHQMVTNELGELPEIRDINLVDFIRLDQKPEVEQEQKKRHPDEPDPPKEEKPPASPKLSQPELPKPAPIELTLPRPELDLPSGIKGIPYVGDFLKTPATKPDARQIKPELDTNVVPIYKIKPAYPPRALRSGIEGVVTVEFIIATDGSVKDPVIIDATPPDIFDHSVLQTIKKWKFPPEIIDGKAVEKRARQDIRFTLK